MDERSTKQKEQKRRKPNSKGGRGIKHITFAGRTQDTVGGSLAEGRAVADRLAEVGTQVVRMLAAGHMLVVRKLGEGAEHRPQVAGIAGSMLGLGVRNTTVEAGTQVAACHRTEFVAFRKLAGQYFGTGFGGNRG